MRVDSQTYRLIELAAFGALGVVDRAQRLMEWQRALILERVTEALYSAARDKAMADTSPTEPD